MSSSFADAVLPIFLRTSRKLLVTSALGVGLSVLAVGPLAQGQALTTASRTGDLQVGGGFSGGISDYAHYRIIGGTFYSGFDFRRHLGVEVDFRQMNSPDSTLYERTYEAGVRYFRDYGPWKPYLKGMYGRGVLNFPPGGRIISANLAYNMIVGGGGVDVLIKPWLSVRADFEYQDWLSGPLLDHGLTPKVGTIGAAYHFGSGRPKGERWVAFKSQPTAKVPRNQQASPPAMDQAPAPASPVDATPSANPAPEPSPDASTSVPPKG